MLGMAVERRRSEIDDLEKRDAMTHPLSGIP